VAVLGAAEAPERVDLGLVDFRQGRFAEAFQDWRLAAAAGDARGALYVGVLYDSGLGVQQNYREAMAWYRRAADAGSAAGAFNIGVLYDAGLGVAKDPAQAAYWYQMAAARKSGRAAYNLGVMYETGSGVPRSRARAVSFFRLAAHQGVAAARAHLAALGQSLPPAETAPHDTSMQDFQGAQQLLLSRGPADAGAAAALFQRSADQRNALAEYDLGYCYEHGLGVPMDAARANALYQRAAADATDPALQTIARAAANHLASRPEQH
jgi:TPR repeat protein